VVAVCRGSIACPVAAVKDWLAAAGITGGPSVRARRARGWMEHAQAPVGTSNSRGQPFSASSLANMLGVPASALKEDAEAAGGAS
jgi:hypothetical protein